MRTLPYCRGALLSLSVLAALSGPGRAAPPVAYKINAAASKFMVHADAGGLFKAFGHDHNIAVREFSGAVQMTEGTVEPAALEMTVKAASLAVTDDVSAGDKAKIEGTMRGQVLEVDKYPQIVFKSKKVTAAKSGEGQWQVKIDGDLTLHGVTKPVQLPATVTLKGHTLRAVGQFELKQTDYSIKPVSVAGGTIKVKNGLKFSFDIEAEQGMETKH